MNIHPIVKDFLTLPVADIYKSSSALDNAPPSVDSFNLVNRLLSTLIPEQKENARNSVHQYLFDKTPKE